MGAPNHPHGQPCLWPIACPTPLVHGGPPYFFHKCHEKEKKVFPGPPSLQKGSTDALILFFVKAFPPSPPFFSLDSFCLSRNYIFSFSFLGFQIEQKMLHLIFLSFFLVFWATKQSVDVATTERGDQIVIQCTKKQRDLGFFLLCQC